MIYDLLIIGAGPAGLTAGIYAKRAGLSVLILDSSPISGGQILNTYEIDNYPGIPGVSGADLGKKMRDHCDRLGVEFAKGRVSSIVDNGDVKEVLSKKENYEARAVIIATGASNKKLGCPGEEEFSGMGVSYCATCDGAFFKDKTVAVVGGGDVALEDALYLARASKKVYLIHRRDQFRGTKVLADEVMACPNIELVMDSVVSEIKGQVSVDSLRISNVKTAEESILAVDGIFVAVGTVPNTGSISGMPNLDERGYIIADETCVTSIPGIFAAGDIRTKQLRQITTATADGANAVTSVQRYFQA
ncbi:MAG: thioredoxin-disulfide reductase [Pseudobutyrivibrio sp.]|nr:thioredoxin-disulfide reductase [Pseudobutyrivibrio sp.]